MSFGYARASLLTASVRDSYTPSLTAEQAAATHAIACILATSGARGFGRVDYVLHLIRCRYPRRRRCCMRRLRAAAGGVKFLVDYPPPSALL